ncbi:MAG: glycosyltransferase family 2 protein [Bacilli bacterium]|nr:glycosyltransferase family 2 protein [Bacilli bacterium]
MFWNWVRDWLYSLIGINLIIDAVENGTPIPAQAYLQLVFSIVTLIFGILSAYRGVYLIIGLFAPARKYPSHLMDKKYAFVLSARNEEKVIANLIDSIRAQDYPQELIDIYVIADNCDKDDKTAEIAEKLGCHVMVRNDPTKQRKGYALQMFFNHIKETIGIDAYYGYAFFDSDNVMAPNFLRKINDAMQEDDLMSCTGYRNVKNLNQNWVTAINGINMYRNSVSVARPRAVVRSKMQLINGTGFVLSYRVLEKNGWDCLTICEDGELSAKLAVSGARMGFCEEAEYYDEQPDTVRISIRQRLRWTKGCLVNWWDGGHRILRSFFRKPTWQKYDGYWDFFPYALFSFLWNLLFQISSLILFFVVGDNGYNWNNFLSFVLTLLAGQYLTAFLTGIVVEIREWKKVHFNLFEAIIYLFVWPFYDMIGVLLNIMCLFMRVTWKPIPHQSIASGTELFEAEQNKGKKKSKK